MHGTRLGLGSEAAELDWNYDQPQGSQELMCRAKLKVPLYTLARIVAHKQKWHSAQRKSRLRGGTVEGKESAYGPKKSIGQAW